MRRFIVPLLLFIFSFSSVTLYGQQIPSNIDFSTINVDALSDQQLTQLLQKAQASGLGVDDIVQQAQAKGMSADQAEKLRDRLNQLGTSVHGETGNDTTGNYTGRRYRSASAADSLRMMKRDRDDAYRRRIFGADLFSNANLTFEPNLNIATPANYVIGPGDELTVDVYGYSEKNDKLRVSPDGFINLPNVGPILVSGLTMDEARTKITHKLESIYSGIASGSTHVQILLGNIRSIQVMLIGEVMRPGAYTLPSLATVANALYVSGGPDINGSFRDIQVIRDGKPVVTFDLYDFLIHGSLGKNILLRDQDIIKVNPYQTRVELSGEVKHPAIFEAREGERLGDIIQYAGGYTSKAYKGFVRAVRANDQEKEIVTVPADSINSYVIRPGDTFYVDSILNRYSNKVVISGSVFHPGDFALVQGMTLKDLIKEADGVTEDAFMSRGLIRRLKPDYSPELINFNVNDVLSGATVLPLQKEDSAFIYSKFKIRERYYVIVGGEVNHPDTIPYVEGMKLGDVILLSGGLRDGASLNQIEVGRRVRSQTFDPKDTTLAILGHFSIQKDLTEDSAASSFVLQPFDRVTVRLAPGYHEQIVVRIEGQVLFPGSYVLDASNEKLSDLIRKAGGVKPEGFAAGSVLLRQHGGDGMLFEKNKLDVFASANKRDDSTEIRKIHSSMDSTIQLVGINLDKAMEKPGSKYDLLLEGQDVVRVPKKLETISLYGEVFYPKMVRFDKRYRFKDFINQGGGFTSSALRRGSYVVYPNGEVASTKKVLFFNHFPKVKPGSEIFVPAKRLRQALGAGELLGITSGLATLAAILITVLK